MTNTLASTILDTIRDSLKLHVGFCRWSDDVDNLFWVCSARDNAGERPHFPSAGPFGTATTPESLESVIKPPAPIASANAFVYTRNAQRLCSAAAYSRYWPSALRQGYRDERIGPIAEYTETQA